MTPMEIGVSTRWNAYRHSSGEELAGELHSLGFEILELGYDLRAELVPGLKKAVEERVVRIVSVHNYCPVPPGVPQGHPELFSLSATDERERTRAVEYTRRTIRFAAEMGAGAVVVHAGRVKLPRMTERLILLYERGQRFYPRYEKYKLALMARRDRLAPTYLERLKRSLEELLPDLEETAVTLALENLPSWESLPTELEVESLLGDLRHERIRYWHDVGHAQVRENLGFISHFRWAERLAPLMAGMHLHDVLPPAYDHLVPPRGEVRFAQLKSIAIAVPRLIMEPAPNSPAEELTQGRAYLQKVWSEQKDAEKGDRG